MRDFFIGSFEKLISVLIILLGIGVVIGALAAMAQEGFFAGIAVLIGGAIYTVVMGGMLYLAFGIYHNTKRTAEAVERMTESE